VALQSRVSRIVNRKRKRSVFPKEPYLCPVCNRVWQTVIGYFGLYKKGNSSEYLTGFPKYGCSKYVCLECKKDSK
tara:strand:- start:667 stop:891 length:225 start_codon:yes stop_codon:yes gene_type:complete